MELVNTVISYKRITQTIWQYELEKRLQPKIRTELALASKLNLKFVRNGERPMTYSLLLWLRSQLRGEDNDSRNSIEEEEMYETDTSQTPGEESDLEIDENPGIWARLTNPYCLACLGLSAMVTAATRLYRWSMVDHPFSEGLLPLARRVGHRSAKIFLQLQELKQHPFFFNERPEFTILLPDYRRNQERDGE